MSMPTKRFLRIGLLGLILATIAAEAAANPPYREATYKRGQLKYIAGLPVLVVEGTPEQIGEQKAVLTGEVVARLASYPKRLFKSLGLEQKWPKFVRMGRAMLPQFPPDHLKELKAFADASGMDRELGLVANTLADVYRGGFGCSSLIVSGQRSATKGPLFGRNLDFYTLGVLDKYSLVTIHRCRNKHAFASIGFPGLFGCLSGMNDVGLALAVHEVFLTRDGAPMFNPKGMPYAFCFRRILEECGTVEEAEALLRATQRTTILSLAVCDRHHAAVLESTPKTVAVRRGKDGICVCTNHFRTQELAVLPWCPRYSKLIRSRETDVLDLSDVAGKLHEVHKKNFTVQTMVFEPVPLVLHLGIGSCPASALPLKRLELAPLLAGSKAADRPEDD